METVENNTGKQPTPLPWKRIITLGLILAANNSSIWMIFAFLPFLVEYFYPSFDRNELGYRAGIMGSAFSAGSFFGNLIWGNLSDRIGRRPVILCGLCGTFISGFCFAFSPTFMVAVCMRFLWGLLNGNIGVCKTYMSEILDDSNNTRGMAIFGVIGGVGRTVGPLIGAFFSEPARRFPSVFAGTVFETFPFALPSVILALNCVAVCIMSYFMLPETLVLRQHHQQNGSIVGGTSKPLELSDSPSNEASGNKTFFGDGDEELEQQGDSKKSISSTLSKLATHTVEMISFDSNNRNKKKKTRQPPRGTPRKAQQQHAGVGYVSLPGSPTDVEGQDGDGDEDEQEPEEDGNNNGHSEQDQQQEEEEEEEESKEHDVENPPSTKFSLHRPVSIDTATATTTASSTNNGRHMTRLNSKHKRVSFKAVVSVKTIDSDLPPEPKNLKSINLGIDRPLSLTDKTTTNNTNKKRRFSIDTLDSSFDDEMSHGGGNGMDTSTSRLLPGNEDDPTHVPVTIVSTNPIHSSQQSEYEEIELNGAATNGSSNNNSAEDHDSNSTPATTLIHRENGLFKDDLRFDNGSTTIDTKKWAPSNTYLGVVYHMYLLMRKKQILMSCLLFGFCGLIQMGTTEVFPLWVVTSRKDGGMDFVTDDIAFVTMISGILVIVSQLGIYSSIVAKVGLLRTYWLGCMINAVTMWALPHLALITERTHNGSSDSSNSNHHTVWSWILLSVALSAQSVSMMWTLTSVFVFINNSCYSHQRGTVNGIGQSLSSLGRLIGPIFFSYTFAWSENNKAVYPFNYFLCFYLLAALSCMNAYGCMMMPKSIQRRKREPSTKPPPDTRPPSSTNGKGANNKLTAAEASSDALQNGDNHSPTDKV